MKVNKKTIIILFMYLISINIAVMMLILEDDHIILKIIPKNLVKAFTTKILIEYLY